MSLERHFRALSYAVVVCGFLAVSIWGSFGWLASGLFIAVFIAAWRLEGTRWQIPEKPGTALIVLTLPLYYLAVRSEVLPISPDETAIAGILARLVSTLSGIKLLQKKSDRDWGFLYLMALFQVMLGAGLSISATFVVVLGAYLVAMSSAVIALNILNTAKKADGEGSAANIPRMPRYRIPLVSLVLIFATTLVAVPLFFVIPRTSAGGMGARAPQMFSGFADRVSLGQIGQIQQNNAVVMRVKQEPELPAEDLYLRGSVLDSFDGRSWTRSRTDRTPVLRTADGSFRLDDPTATSQIIKQTVYLEPIGTSLIFASPKILEVSGVSGALLRDRYGSLEGSRRLDRVSYTAVVDVSSVEHDVLQSASERYRAGDEEYLGVPDETDRGIFDLARDLTLHHAGHFDKAVAIEKYLRGNYGYTLEQRAAGPQPLSDFLFNVKEGHCEYFASAMALMLRTQGVPTRVATGFRGGEFNKTAGVTIVRQRNAHAWVEVYFPAADRWVRFDPTPPLAWPEEQQTGRLQWLTDKVDGIEALWIQYVVSYDDNGQSQLLGQIMGSSERLLAFTKTRLSLLLTRSSDWLAGRQSLGDQFSSRVLLMLAAAVAFFAFIAFFLQRFYRVPRFSKQVPAIDFYAEAETLLRSRGFAREKYETPSEFAARLPWWEMAELTSIYNDVRFGSKPDPAAYDHAQFLIQALRARIKGEQASLSDN